MTELTWRERALLPLVADGLTNRAIAEQLGLKENSVKKYLSAMYMKFGCTNRTTLVAKGRERGWITSASASLSLEDLESLIAASPLRGFARAVLAGHGSGPDRRARNGSTH